MESGSGCASGARGMGRIAGAGCARVRFHLLRESRKIVSYFSVSHNFHVRLHLSRGRTKLFCTCRWIGASARSGR